MKKKEEAAFIIINNLIMVKVCENWERKLVEWCVLKSGRHGSEFKRRKKRRQVQTRRVKRRNGAATDQTGIWHVAPTLTCASPCWLFFVVNGTRDVHQFSQNTRRKKKSRVRKQLFFYFFFLLFLFPKPTKKKEKTNPNY